MTERTYIPASPACGLWETQLADALEGLLSVQDEAAFIAHMDGCPACTSLFEEARRGREWLQFLSPELEMPDGLLDRILTTTGPGHRAVQEAMPSAGAAVIPPGLVIPAWQRPGFMSQVRRWAEPRLMMTAAMAFFSIALTLNLAGVRLTDVKLANLRPVAVRAFMERRLTMASVPIIRYYDHLRFVYEVQSTMRQLRGQTGDNQNNQQEKQAPAAGAGESKQMQKGGGSRVDPPQQSGKPAARPPQNDSGDYVEASLTIGGRENAVRRLQKSAMEEEERSGVWTA